MSPIHCLLCNTPTTTTPTSTTTTTPTDTNLLLCKALSLSKFSPRVRHSPICEGCCGRVQGVKHVVMALESLQRTINEFRLLILDTLVEAEKEASASEGDSISTAQNILRRDIIGGLSALRYANEEEDDDGVAGRERRKVVKRKNKKRKKSVVVDHDDEIPVKTEIKTEIEEVEEQFIIPNDPTVDNDDEDPTVDDDDNPSPPLLHYCTLCSSSTSFETSFDLDVHTKRVHLHKKQPFSCPHCPRTFRQRYLWKKHLSIHSTGIDLLKRFTCDYGSCTKSYETANSLQRHKSSHSGDWKFPCPSCSRGFHRPSALKVHEAKEHGADPPYPCTHCDLKFTTPRLRLVHISSSHPEMTTKQNTTICEACSKVFSGRDALRCHKIQVHGDESESGRRTLFACGECGKVFAKKSWLNRHSLQHSTAKTFACDECEDSFRFPNSLATHKLKHAALTPFTCSICGKGFRLRTQRNLHEGTHTAKDNKGHICEYCGKRFALGVYLSHHVKRIHYKEIGLEGKPGYMRGGGRRKSNKNRKNRRSGVIKKQPQLIQESEELNEMQVLKLDQVVYQEEGISLQEVVVDSTNQGHTHQMVQVLQLGTGTLDKDNNEQFIQVFVQRE